jgi:hypothetical protein
MSNSPETLESQSGNLPIEEPLGQRGDKHNLNDESYQCFKGKLHAKE